MSFDLLAYAAAHRYRVRNLHDGRPVPPVRIPGRGRRGASAGYTADDDREDAIVCRYGYVTYDGGGQLGWCLLSETVRAKSFRLRRLVDLGATMVQEGDTEAAGSVSVEHIAEVLGVLEPYRIADQSAHPARFTRAADPTPGAGSDAPGRSSTQVRRGSKERDSRTGVLPGDGGARLCPVRGAPFPTSPPFRANGSGAHRTPNVERE